AMLWPALARRVESLMKRAQLPAPAAISEAAPEVIVTQCRRTVIPRRFSTPMREIWELQQRLLARRSPQKLAAHPRFRAAYDFVLLREQAGEQLDGAGDWWTRFQNGESVGTAPTSQRRRRRRRSPGRNRADGD
ncbi:MAG TPA: polynucleotide adenylyltransferase PcnB, partial [Pseudomonadales bacterium]|nr:polynucleotide adenylyltransferase PcnB [Pseudomonadales bacterium]